MQPILYLAPLHGVTHSIFRNIYHRHFTGIDYVVAPFISTILADKARARGKGNHFKDILPENNPHFALIPQVIGNDATRFIETAKTIRELGYHEVNLNMGCPFPVVTKKKKGSGFLPHADLIRRFLDEVCTQTKIDLSLKVRLGLNEPEELIALMPLFNTYPLKKIIIHPRTGKQMYEGSVDLDAFEYAADLSIHEIMYNGDIKDVATFTMLQSRFPKIREWMIGRWAIFNPFLPSLIKGNEQTACPLSIIRNFHDDLYQTYAEVLCGPGHLLDKMKEIWNYLGKSCVGEEKRLSRLARVKNLDQYNETVKALFEQGHWLLS